MRAEAGWEKHIGNDKTRLGYVELKAFKNQVGLLGRQLEMIVLNLRKSRVE
jgi:hypothetical protein